MKKAFLFLAMIAMTSFVVACSDDDKDDKTTTVPDEKESTGDNEETGEEGTSFTALITIDGDFADWDEVTATVATQPEDAVEGNGLQKLAVCADEMFLYIYVEIDEDSFDTECTWTPFAVYLNMDGNTETGATIWLWDPSGFEAVFESALWDGSMMSWDGSAMTRYDGPDGEDFWNVEDEFRVSVPVSGVGKGAGEIADGLVKYEISMMRALIPNLGNDITVGVLLQNGGWTEEGHLPCGSKDADGNESLVGMLSISMPEAI